MMIRSFLNILRDPEPAAGGSGGGTPAPAAQSGGAPASGGAAPAPSPAPAGDGGSPAPGAQPPGGPGGEPTPAKPAEGFWKDDWRQQYAGQDVKRLKELERYASPKAALDGLFAAKQRIQEGSLIPALKKDASPDEVKAYRDSLGVPEKPEGYEIKLSGDRTIDADDKPLVDKLVAKLHGLHARPEIVNATVDAFLDIEESLLGEQEQSDTAALKATEDELRMEWGGDYRRNVAMINGLLDSAPTGVKDALLSARDSEGITLLNNPSIMRWLADVTRQVNPTATVVPGSNNPQAAISDELTNLKKMMGDYNSEYWKGPNKDKLQQRFRDLTSVQSKAA